MTDDNYSFVCPKCKFQNISDKPFVQRICSECKYHWIWGSGYEAIKSNTKKVYEDQLLQISDSKEYINELFRHTPEGKIKIKIDDLENYDDLELNYLNKKPIIYDKYRIWWSWNKFENRWEMVDDTDISISFNSVYKMESNAFKSSVKTAIMNALKDSARKFFTNNIKDLDKDKVVFKNYIYDVFTKEKIVNDFNYFSTNPIPFDIIDGDLDTPKIDELFEQWVGKDNVQILYEIIGYCMLPDYPIHRAFCLIGRGRNGKSKFLEIVARTVGAYNVTASDLTQLSKNTFESASLYKKLVCIIGETDFNLMSDTSLFKRITGQDRIGAQFKNKPKFEFVNYAKILIATNNLPITLDKTDAFYARWIIVDFKNQFDGTKDILKDIPIEEYGKLANKCLGYLTSVLTTGMFYKEGNINDKAKIYEDKSNPLQLFIEKNCIEVPTGQVYVYEFYDRLCLFLNENGYRLMSKVTVSQTMKTMNYELGKEYDNDAKKEYRCYFGLKWKDGSESNTPTKSELSDFVNGVVDLERN
jgi:putative DNA primase/helicase